MKKAVAFYASINVSDNWKLFEVTGDGWAKVRLRRPSISHKQNTFAFHVLEEVRIMARERNP